MTWDEVRRMPCREFMRARKAAMQVYAQERLHDISCNNLSMAGEEMVQRVIDEFMAMRRGEPIGEGREGDLDSLKAHLRLHL